MKSFKFLPGLAVLVIAALGAFASAKTYAPTNVFYPVGVPNTASEDCLPHTVNKTCTLSGFGCIDDIEDVGEDIQLYQTRVAIEGTDRFRCQTTLQENP